MVPFDTHDYLQDYLQAASQLDVAPGDQSLQHKAVLSLARTGSLDFALSEYERFGLPRVRYHEDIMALAGRLYKDFYLRSTGKIATEHARTSAQKYESAFQDTGGFYSGINAATMALMADMPKEIVLDRAEAVLAKLPTHESLTPSDHYFIEASRAEALLLGGDIAGATSSLAGAIEFDPLAYTAHAATLKQFSMICAKHGQDQSWLSPFSPPRPVHYAGHIWSSEGAKIEKPSRLSPQDMDAISTIVSDSLQQNDIGFGYGALAAGADIIVAEALLEEGAQLHLVLPCSWEDFLASSIRPFGDGWEARAQICYAAASSVTVLTQGARWPDAQLNRMTGRAAMGKTIMQSSQLNVQPAQLIIWNGKHDESYSSLHVADWSHGCGDQIILPKMEDTRDQAAPSLDNSLYKICMKRSDAAVLEHFENIEGAAQAALAVQAVNPAVKIGLHIDVFGTNCALILDALTGPSMPAGIFMSDLMASVLTHYTACFDQNGEFGAALHEIKFAGIAACKGEAVVKAFALGA